MDYLRGSGRCGSEGDDGGGVGGAGGSEGGADAVKTINHNHKIRSILQWLLNICQENDLG